MRTMNRISHLNKTQFDLIVIGGGAVGAGIVRDGALRGLKSLLVDKGDFGSGTSSRTSKIAHGGIRYLEQGEFGLVFESLRERFILEKIAPHLVHPLPFLFPVYDRGPRPLWKIRAGLWLYDLLSLFRNKKRFRVILKEEMLRCIPGLKSEGLKGGGIYYDSQMNDARVVLENILDAKSHGATVLNYVQADQFRSNGRRLVSVVLTDQLYGGSAEVYGGVFVNAGGPWVTEIAEKGGDKRPVRIRMTQGTHLIVPEISKDYAVVVSPEEEDRIFFVIPWHGNTLIGTTDLDFSGDPSDVHPLPEEVNYLLGETRKVFPGLLIKKEDIVSIFSGVRPLLNISGSRPSGVTRRVKIVESPSGMISIAGGKMTTYRSTAEKVVDLVGKRLARTDLGGCSTATEPLYGGRFRTSFPDYRRKNAQRWSDRFQLAHPIVIHLISQYGNRAPEILDRAEKDRMLGEKISPEYANIFAEIHYAMDCEMALTLSDFLRRRTLLALGGLTDPRVLRELSEIMGKKLEWNEERREMEVKNYLKEMNPSEKSLPCC
ncbi:MAG: glycerol-3-phosphate dehydrogenase/oxidase [Nitrospirae bacterium]|nr:glycerol-3-phosphate dehydrogenase/oxidase [Nitrospirota bacterium]